MSLAVASGYVTTAPPELVVVTETSAGTVTVGGVVSWIVIVADFVTVVVSTVVWHVTVVEPSGK